MPPLDIIVTTYNWPEALALVLKALARQSRLPAEVIVADDGSRADTRQLLERLGAWNAGAATAIRSIHVSQRGGFGRTRIDAGEHGLPSAVVAWCDFARPEAASLIVDGLEELRAAA